MGGSVTDTPPPVTGPEAQVRALYRELREDGQAADEARSAVAIATLANGLSALCVAVHEMATERYGDAVPPSILGMIGHANTASRVTARIVLGSLDLDGTDGE